MTWLYQFGDSATRRPMNCDRCHRPTAVPIYSVDLRMLICQRCYDAHRAKKAKEKK